MTRFFLRRTTAVLALTAMAGGLMSPMAQAQETRDLLRPKARPGSEIAVAPTGAPEAIGEAVTAGADPEASTAAGIATAPRSNDQPAIPPAPLGNDSATQNDAAGASLFATEQTRAENSAARARLMARGSSGDETGGVTGDATGDGSGLADDRLADQGLAVTPETAPETNPETPSENGIEVARQVAVLSPAPVRPQARPEGLEPVAKKCLAPEQIRDRDIQRNLEAFYADTDLCISQETFSEHGRNWHLVIVTNRSNKRGPVWAILHDNENSAFDTGLYSVSRYGGKIVAVESGETRSFKGQDPNRNFGNSKNITGPCRAMNPKPSPKFTRAISRHFTKRHPIMTMHTNENGHAAAGGRGHISAARSSATMRGFMASNPKRGLSDEDNAILTAGTKPYDSNKKVQKLVSHFGKRGINVIYEHVRPAKNDCSFSFHALLNNMGDYYNIEVEHGRTEDQKRILDALMNYIGVAPLY